jgi:hypothetical protein
MIPRAEPGVYVPGIGGMRVGIPRPLRQQNTIMPGRSISGSLPTGWILGLRSR